MYKVFVAEDVRIKFFFLNHCAFLIAYSLIDNVFAFLGDCVKYVISWWISLFCTSDFANKPIISLSTIWISLISLGAFRMILRIALAVNFVNVTIYCE